MDREYFGVNPKLSFKNYSGLNVVKLFISKKRKKSPGDLEIESYDHFEKNTTATLTGRFNRWTKGFMSKARVSDNLDPIL